MSTAQGLRGLVGQGMNGKRRSYQGYLYQYTPGSYTFTAPKAGYWTVVLWGAGGPGTTSTPGFGGGAALSIKTAFLSVGQAVAITVAASDGGSRDSTATFPSGAVMTAGGGALGGTGTGGTASGGDVNVDGSAGSGTTGGAAASYGEYRGGAGGAGAEKFGQAPGGGSGPATSGISNAGGSGLAMVFYVKS